MRSNLCSSLLILVLWFSLSQCQGKRYIQGKRIYEYHCMSCHLEGGEGLGELYPSLTKSTFLTSNISELPCLIRTGRQSRKLSTLEMPANTELTDIELLNLMNYLRADLMKEKVITPNELEQFLKACK